jgi:uncharacterized membrane protein YeiH
MTFEERNRLLASTPPLQVKSENLPVIVAVVGIVIAFAFAKVVRRKK